MYDIVGILYQIEHQIDSLEVLGSELAEMLAKRSNVGRYGMETHSHKQHWKYTNRLH